MKWKVVENKVTGTEFTVKDMLKGVLYEFRVTAENKVGQGEPSDPSKRVKYGKTFHSLLQWLIIWLSL